MNAESLIFRKLTPNEFKAIKEYKEDEETKA